MPIPPTVQRYLNALGAPYSVLGAGSEVSAAVRVQAVLLTDADGPVLAVLPADHQLDLARLNQQLRRRLDKASRELTQRTFPDCDAGAVPALGQAYGVTVCVDRAVDNMPLVTFDSGSAGTLLRVSGQVFGRLQPDARRELQFATPAASPIPEALLGLPRFDIRARLELPGSLPAAPASAPRLLALRTDPRAGAEELREAIGADPAIAAQILRYANSAIHLGRGGCESLERAIVVIGFDVALNMALGMAVMGSLHVPARMRAALGQLWRYAVYTAAACEMLARAIPATLAVKPGAAYLAGLLQDVGWLVLAQRFPLEFQQWRRAAAACGRAIDPLELQRHMLGLTHAEIGAALLRAWGLPEEIVTGVQYHDIAWYAGPGAVYPQLVLVANRALARHGLSAEHTDLLPAGSLLALSFTEALVRRTVERVTEAQGALNELASQLAA